MKNIEETTYVGADAVVALKNGDAPISGIAMKAERNRMFADLKSNSFLSQRAFKKKPKRTQDMKSEITACVSLKTKPNPMSKIVYIPAICSKKPKFAKMGRYIGASE